MTHLMASAARRQDGQADAPCIALKTPTKCSRLATNRVRERGTQHRGEECRWRGRPHLGGMCRVKWLKKWSDVTTRPLPFCMVYAEKGRSRCYVAPVLPDKMCENYDLEPQRQL